MRFPLFVVLRLGGSADVGIQAREQSTINEDVAPITTALCSDFSKTKAERIL